MFSVPEGGPRTAVVAHDLEAADRLRYRGRISLAVIGLAGQGISGNRAVTTFGAAPSDLVSLAHRAV